MSGTGEYGRIYEQKMVALFAIRCALDQNVADFWILSNLTGFGAFDDIILHVENRDGSKKLYCIQLKHVENGSLQIRQLIANEGVFSLWKYSDSYETIMNTTDFEFLNQPDLDRTSSIHFILYTNLPFKGKRVSDSIELEKKDAFDIFCTSIIPDNTFSVNTSNNSKNPFNEAFLRQFSLCIKQVSASALDRLIKNELQSHFTYISDNVIIYITDFFVQWVLNKEKDDNKLFKNDVQLKLVEYLLQTHIIEPRLVYEPVSKFSTLALLNDTIINFNVTPNIQKESLANICSSVRYTVQELCDFHFNFETSWNTSLTDDQLNILKDTNKEKTQQIINVLEERRYYVPDLTVNDLYLSAWQCNLIPLLIDSDSSHDLIKQLLLKLKDVFVSLSIVLLTDGVGNIETTLKVFNSFSDINDDDLINRYLDSTYVSLQGKPPLNLREFKESVDVLGEITPDIYVTLLNGILRIGEEHEIENYYIKRVLQAPRLNYNVLDKSNVLRESTERHIFLMVEFERCEYLFSRIYMSNMVDLMMFIENYASGTISEEKYILTSTLSHTDEKIKQAIEYLRAEMKLAVHVVEQRRNYFLWLSSTGPIDVLHDYIYEPKEELTDDQIDEDTMLDHFRSNVHIISNNAGMGKTLMLRSLANKYESNKWVCCINLSEHMTRFSQIKQSALYMEYITEQQVEVKDELVRNFCRKIFLNRCNSGNSVWLLDGYDEVSLDILPFLKCLKKWKNKIWITTRLTYKRELEEYMSTLSIEIAPFRETDFETFVWKYFDSFRDIYRFNEEQIKKIINTICEYSSGIDKTLLAIPLQTRMLTEIIGDDISLIEREKLTLVELYDKFVDVKLKEYKSYEAVALRRTLSQLALKLFYTQEQLEDLLDLTDLAEEAQAFRESYKKDSIVIGLNKKGDAVFGHRSFAEYLAAQWLTRQIITRKGTFAENWKSLVEQLFYLDLIPIRAFFDRILCQRLPLHLSVLNNDIDNLKSILNDNSTQPQLDALGRSPLHLAVSYGTYYDVYTSNKNQQIYQLMHDFISGHTLKAPVKKTQYQISTSVIKILLEHRYLNTFDALFFNDVFDYATKSCSLDSLDCLFKTMEKKNLIFLPGFDFRKFLYCIVCDNLHNVLSSRKKYNFTSPCRVNHKIRTMFIGEIAKFFKMMYHEAYLTEIAAYTGSMEVLFELIQSHLLTVNDGLPIHKACCIGHSDVVELLFKMGADIQKQDIKYTTVTQVVERNPFYTIPMTEDMKVKAPIHYAAQRGHLECIQKLTILGASVMTKDANGYTPLYYSTLYGHMSCVLFMLDTLTDEEKHDDSVQSILNVTASRGYSTEQLVDYGLNVNNIDKDGNTPVILASKNGFPTIIEELSRSPNCDLNLMKTNENSWSIRRWPIQQSVEIRQRKTRNTYLSFFDMNLKLFCPKTGKDAVVYGGLAAIHFAILRGRVECVKTLIRLGADKNIEDTVGLGYSPIIWAAITGHDEIIKILLPTESTSDTYLALVWASILGYNSCVSILLHINIEKLCDLESSCHLNRLEPILRREYAPYYDKIDELFGRVKNIPLVLAVLNNRLSVVHNLITVRYMENRDLNVALFWASKEGYLECLKLLIAAGADVSLKTSGPEKMLPLSWASMNGQVEVVKFLLTGISTEYLTSYDIDLAVKYASAGNHRKCVDLLIGFGVNTVDSDNELGACSTELLNARERENLIKKKNLLLSMNCDLLLRISERNVRYNNLGKKIFNISNKLSALGVHQYGSLDNEIERFKRLQKSLDQTIANNENELVYKFTELGETKKDTD